jgi:predicted metal-dependent peptidase|tara:strand:+ start:12 stop:1394 length:1383 start_codon:yes stop_codon:yes gene_type:complete
MTNYTPLELVIRARASVNRDLGMASMLLPLKLIEDETKPTMATDGRKIYYSPDYVQRISHEEIQTVLVHEALHVRLEHHLRMGNRNHELWNIACDYVINGYLVDVLNMPLPEGGLYDPRFKGMSAEKVYAILDDELDQEQDQNDESNSNQSGNDSDSDSDSDKATEDEQQSTGKYSSEDGTQKTANKPNKSKYDNLPVSMGEIIKPTHDDGTELSKSELQEMADTLRQDVVMGQKLDKSYGGVGSKSILGGISDIVRASEVRWSDILRDHLLSSDDDEHTWSKPNRRHAWRDVYLPSQKRSENGGQLAVAIDSSASVTQTEANYMAKEVKAIAEELNLDKVRVCYCDTRVQKNSDGEWWDVFDLSCGDEIEFELRGFGGTQFDPVMQLVNEDTDDIDEVQALIYFTDGDCYVSPELEPNLPVYWGITQKYYFKDGAPIDSLRRDIPFGELIYVNAEEAYR